jgi:hypothetical protein
VITYLLNNQFQHDLRRGAQIVQLQILGFVEAVFWGQGTEERVRAFVQGHGARGMGSC